MMGILGFTSTGMWSRTGRIGIEPLRWRTRPDRRDWRIDEPLLEGMSFIKELLALEPKREAPVRAPSLPHVIAASDAQADSWPTGGFLVLDPSTGDKYGEYFTFHQEFLTLVGFPPEQLKDGNPIAQCEAAAVVMVMLACGKKFTPDV